MAPVWMENHRLPGGRLSSDDPVLIMLLSWPMIIYSLASELLRLLGQTLSIPETKVKNPDSFHLSCESQE